MADDRFQGWAILELMGHRRLAGWVTETELAGQGVLRLDVPHESDAADEAAEEHGEDLWLATQFYAPSALYCLTPTTEDVARALAARNRPEPVHRWELLARRRQAAAREDLATGEQQSQEIRDDYVIATEFDLLRLFVCAGTCHVAHVSDYPMKGTHVLTVKGRGGRGGDRG